MSKPLNKYNQCFWLSDWHIPFEDKKAVNKALAHCKLASPKVIIIGGDMLDFPQISKFDYDPSKKTRLVHDLRIARNYLKRLRADNPKSEIVFLEGNHSLRWVKYLNTKASEFSGLEELTLESMLGLPQLNIKWYDYDDPYYLTDNFICVHGSVVRKWAGYSAKGELDRWGISGISGHVHRLSHYLETKRGITQQWIEGGCLCDMNPHYMKNPNWQQGYVVLNYNSKEVVPELIRL